MTNELNFGFHLNLENIRKARDVMDKRERDYLDYNRYHMPCYYADLKGDPITFAQEYGAFTVVNGTKHEIVYRPFEARINILNRLGNMAFDHLKHIDYLAAGEAQDDKRFGDEWKLCRDILQFCAAENKRLENETEETYAEQLKALRK